MTEFTSEERSPDRRVRRTRRQLKECLLTLLKEKKIQEITVRELTEMADLNRGTFYLHYKDVYDLLEQTESELLDEFNRLFLKERPEDLEHRIRNIFYDIYALTRDNADLVTLLIGEHGDLNFINLLENLVRDQCLHDWMEVYRGGSTAVFDAYFSFVVSGCVGLVQHWLRTGMKESPEQMSLLTEKIIIQGIQVLSINPIS